MRDAYLGHADEVEEVTHVSRAPSSRRGACRPGYGKMAVVRDVDLHVDAGEVVALIGANGAGKTTTLLTLAGELAPMEGEVRFLGAADHGRRCTRGAATASATSPRSAR